MRRPPDDASTADAVALRDAVAQCRLDLVRRPPAGASVAAAVILDGAVGSDGAVAAAAVLVAGAGAVIPAGSPAGMFAGPASPGGDADTSTFANLTATVASSSISRKKNAAIDLAMVGSLSVAVASAAGSLFAAASSAAMAGSVSAARSTFAIIDAWKVRSTSSAAARAAAGAAAGAAVAAAVGSVASTAAI